MSVFVFMDLFASSLFVVKLSDFLRRTYSFLLSLLKSLDLDGIPFILPTDFLVPAFSNS